MPERPSQRRAELLEHAAAASRESMRSRAKRLTATARPILHTSVAAAGAWFVASELLHHEAPFFAPVASVITLGLTVGERRRRAVEIAVGVAVGIAIADALAALIGTGTWQIAVVVGLAMVGALLVGGGPLLASQAGVSAVLVATLSPPDGGIDVTRFFDALVGGGVALVVSSLLLPVDPLRLLRGGAEPLLRQLSAALEGVADALAARDPGAAERALEAMRGIEPAYAALADALATAGETIRFVPGRRRARARLGPYSSVTAEVRLALNNMRVLARGAVRAIQLGDATPPEVVAAMRELAQAVLALGPWLWDETDPAPARAAAVRAAGLANAVLEETANLSAVHLVGQIRLTAVDLLRATGVEREEANQAVRGASAVAAQAPSSR